MFAGEVLLSAAGKEVTRWNQRAIGVAVVTGALLLHGLLPTWGIRLQNVLGFFKIGVLLFIIITGELQLRQPSAARQSSRGDVFTVPAALDCVLTLSMLPGFVALGGHVPGGAPSPSNFTNAFKGSRVSANAFVNALYSVIWAFVGYSNAGYALSEIRNPIRTIKIAAPLAMLLVTILYLLVNIAFFAVVPKQELIESNR